MHVPPTPAHVSIQGNPRQKHRLATK